MYVPSKALAAANYSYYVRKTTHLYRALCLWNSTSFVYLLCWPYKYHGCSSRFISPSTKHYNTCTQTFFYIRLFNYQISTLLTQEVSSINSWYYKGLIWSGDWWVTSSIFWHAQPISVCSTAQRFPAVGHPVVCLEALVLLCGFISYPWLCLLCFFIFEVLSVRVQGSFLPQPIQGLTPFLTSASPFSPPLPHALCSVLTQGFS